MATDKITLARVRERLGDQQTADLAMLAIDMLIAAPAKQQQYTYAAKIPWRMIHEGRSVLDAAGLDWRKLRREQ